MLVGTPGPPGAPAGFGDRSGGSILPRNLNVVISHRCIWFMLRAARTAPWESMATDWKEPGNWCTSLPVATSRRRMTPGPGIARNLPSGVRTMEEIQAGWRKRSVPNRWIAPGGKGSSFVGSAPAGAIRAKPNTSADQEPGVAVDMVSVSSSSRLLTTYQASAWGE